MKASNQRQATSRASLPPDYRPNLIHQLILLADLLSGTPPLSIGPALVGMAAIGAWPWGEPALQAIAGVLTLLAIVGDGVSLALLPRKGRSCGPVTPPLLALALVRSGLALALGLLWPSWPALGLTAAFQLALTAGQVYATWVEPFRLQVTRVELTSPRLRGDRPLRVLHVSDIHFEIWSPRERRLLEVARELAPDLILVTGDYLNLSSVEEPAAQKGVRELMEALSSLAPTWAIAGSPPVDRSHVVPAIFQGLPIRWLLDEAAEVEVEGHPLRLLGLRCTKDRRRDGARLRSLLPEGAGETFTVLLYHSPDLMPDAVKAGVDLYLAGHTHGGQVRLPLFGAIFTSSDFWKRYEAGLYQEGGTVLYVSRGLGVEGLGAPRARFLSPPELVLLTLSPSL